MPAPLVLPAPSPPAPTTTQGSTFRPLLIFNFCTYANLRQIRIGINRAMNSLMTDTKAAEKHAEFRDIPPAGSSQKYNERKG